MSEDGYIYGPNGFVLISPLLSDYTKYMQNLRKLAEDSNQEVASAASSACNKLWRLENKKLTLEGFKKNVIKVQNNLGENPDGTPINQSVQSYNYIIDRIIEHYEGKR